MSFNLPSLNSLLRVVSLVVMTIPLIDVTLAMRQQPSIPAALKNGMVQIFFNPSLINARLYKDTNRTFYFNCTVLQPSTESSSDNSSLQRQIPIDSKYGINKTYTIHIVSDRERSLRFILPPDMVNADPRDPEFPGPYLRKEITLPIQLNTIHNFTIQAMYIGYVTMSVTVYDTDSLTLARANLAAAIGRAEYRVTVTSRQKLADFIFDCSAAAVAILISFGIGCVTNTENLKRQLKYPVSLVIGFCCQFLLMPVLAFGLAMILPLEKNVRFGLLCVACVPGGGLGHVAVIISGSDLPLSLTMNLISIVTMLGAAPLWIFVLGQYFQQTVGSKIIPIYNFEIWLASTFFSYTAGLVINRFKPCVADAILTWLIKPFLLLSTILYVTLGVYINMYVFEVIEQYTVVAAILLPLCGFLVGTVLSIIFRQKPSFCRTVAIETSSLNCLIVLAALRFSLNQPDADLASVIPIWVMFTIPGLYVLLAILRILKKSIDGILENRKQKEYRQYSIASGIINQANMAALSAPLFVSETYNTDDEQASVSEKITVL
ncbi:hypothetical protein CHS0354_029006 [Potamilus streckersoni]|uniref:Uncharacterized protein n=1 Tax=Potamilus streckersoni TaxID=2493646 RepID=A0AAE0SFU8_9BIVA|nr:hypothetical protein CHS0354_029006 [Potamilus streckersoni]